MFRRIADNFRFQFKFVCKCSKLLSHSLRNNYTRSETAVKLSFLCNEVQNSKNPLLVYHGLLGSKVNWRVLSTKLSDATTRTAYTFDVRDHGDSPHTDELTYGAMVNDLLHFMNEIKCEKSVLIGHSLGGRAICQFASIYPERVEKMVVVDIGIKNVNTAQSSILNVNLIKTMQKASKYFSSDLSLSEIRRKVDEHLKPIVPDPFIRGFLLLNLRKSNGNVNWNYNLNAIASLLENGSLNDLKLSKPFVGPVLFIHGGKSDYVRQNDYEYICEWFPNCKFECIPDGNHYLHIQCQNEFLDKVVSFVNSI